MRSAGVAKAFLKFLFKETTVRQASQRIMPRQIARIQLCCGTRLDFAGEVLIAAKTVDHRSNAQHKNDEDEVVHFPVSVIQSKLKQMRRKIISVRQEKNDNSDHEQHKGIPCVASFPVEPL